MPVLLFQYIRWHYTVGLVDVVHIIGNFVWFFYSFFSIPLLLKTFFVPFHRLQEEDPTGLDIGRIFEKLVVNGLMRFVGMLLRTLLILFGLLAILCTCVLGAIFLCMWLAAPLICVLLLLYGVLRLFL